MRQFMSWTAVLLGTLHTLGGAQTLKPGAQTYALGTTVTIRYEEVRQDLGSPYIALVNTGTPDDQDTSLHLTYLTTTPSGEVTFRGVAAGTYQARLYYASTVNGVIARTPLTVQGPTAPKPAVKPAPAQPRPASTPPAAATPTKPPLATLLGSWQCLTRQQAANELMFTFRLNSATSWTDLTFGTAKTTTSRASYNVGSGVLRLNTTQGARRYDFEYLPAGNGQKERLVERVTQQDLYRAQVCYRRR